MEMSTEIALAITTALHKEHRFLTDILEASMEHTPKESYYWQLKLDAVERATAMVMSADWV